jgi:hypothetical protein
MCAEENEHPTLTDSALYSPPDEPEAFVGFGFVLIIDRTLDDT